MSYIYFIFVNSTLLFRVVNWNYSSVLFYSSFSVLCFSWQFTALWTTEMASLLFFSSLSFSLSLLSLLCVSVSACLHSLSSVFVSLYLSFSLFFSRPVLILSSLSLSHLLFFYFLFWFFTFQFKKLLDLASFRCHIHSISPLPIILNPCWHLYYLNFPTVGWQRRVSSNSITSLLHSRINLGCSLSIKCAVLALLKLEVFCKL